MSDDRKTKNLIPLKDLNLSSRFLFDEVMEDPLTRQETLSIIFDREIPLLNYNETEKEFRVSPLIRSIRMDVFSMDEEKIVYGTEMQDIRKTDIAKRSRYYQALMDTSLLEPGIPNYNLLNNSYLILILTFDLFGYGKYRYTFSPQCEEIPQCRLQDGAVRIFLNTKGTDDSQVSRDLIEFLHYIENTTDDAARNAHSDRIRRIHNRVKKVKANEEIGVKYMQAWEEQYYAKQEAREEGLAEGRAEGRAKGIAEGRAEGRVEGRAEGRAEGITEGRIEARETLNKLIKRLLDDNRLEDIKKSVEDEIYQDKLLKEYGLFTDTAGEAGMRIRKTTLNDLDAVMKIYARARGFMAETGNPTQWKDSYPSEELIRRDIADGASYVCVEKRSGDTGADENGSSEDSEVIEAVFMYDMREDPTYAVIEDGAWPNDRPYGVLHRIAGSGRRKGVASFCMQWCFAQCGNLRCDTHDNNKIMQHVLKKNGFEYCGRIYVEDGSPRVAFQKVR